MFRYAKAAAQKLTQTVIETAIKGGGGIVQTLKKSYSMNDLNNLGEEETKRVSNVDVNLDRKRCENFTLSEKRFVDSLWPPLL
jgi:hypothetical protein